jgi:hypothetical protein
LHRIKIRRDGTREFLLNQCFRAVSDLV